MNEKPFAPFVLCKTTLSTTFYFLESCQLQVTFTTQKCTEYIHVSVGEHAHKKSKIIFVLQNIRLNNRDLTAIKPYMNYFL